MAKWGFDETGSSCHVHSSLWTPDGDDRAVRRRARRRQHGMSDLFRHYLAGLDRHRTRVLAAVGARRQQLQALPARLVGADGHRMGRRQPHARLPQGRPRRRRPGSSAASPAATRTATSRSPARSPAGCTASATSSSSASRSSATATTAPTSHAGPVEHRRRDRAVGAVGDRAASASATTSTTTSSRWRRPSGRPSTRRSPTGSCAATGSGPSRHIGRRPLGAEGTRTHGSTRRPWTPEWQGRAGHRRRVRSRPGRRRAVRRARARRS